MTALSPGSGICPRVLVSAALGPRAGSPILRFRHTPRQHISLHINLHLHIAFLLFHRYIYTSSLSSLYINVIASNYDFRSLFHLSIANFIASTYAPSPRRMVNTRRMEKSMYCNIFTS
jgi:hypothetical protein